MKKLILTEKPNVTKQIKDVLAPNAKYIRGSQSSKNPLGYYENENFVICNTVGHCINIKTPLDINKDFTWDLNKIPYNFPDPLPLEVAKDKHDIFNIIQLCFSKYNYDEIIIATDGDREGQNIWRKINLMLKPYSTKKISRIWLDEWTPEGIQHAYDTRFPNEQKDSLAEAAQCREESDYLIGMNCTPALTAKYCTNKNIASIGRVMGPTMHIVYERELEIQNFIPKPYISLVLQTESDTNEILELKMKKANGYTEAEADRFIKLLPQKALLNKTTKKISKKCPELYDATTIAQDMNKRYGFSAKKTSDIIQKLYQDYALTTYPGTNARKMSEGSAQKAYQALNNLTLYADEVEEIKTNRWTVSPHVITTEGLAHEAITPVYGTTKQENIKKLTADEMKVYKAIVERFLSVFYPKAEFEENVITTTINNEDFEVRGKTLLEAGWMKITGMPKDTLLPQVQNGKMYQIRQCVSTKKKTTPPSRYTEDTLLSAMKNAGRFVTNKKETAILKEIEGLGTGRTRPAIIENIKKRGYFEEKKNSIYPTQKCFDLFNVLPNTTLSSPSLTAQFEEMIQSVENGTMTRKEYMAAINQDINEIIQIIKSDTSNKKIGNNTSVSATNAVQNLICPICGHPIIENSKAYACSDRKNGCKFTIWKEQYHKKLTTKQIEDLIKNGTTKQIKGFKKANGTDMSPARLAFDLKPNGDIDWNSKVSLHFDNAPSTSSHGQSKSFGTCPECGHEMYEDSKQYYCPKCNVHLQKNALLKYGKKNITAKEANQLLDGQIITLTLTSPRTKNQWNAKVYFDTTTNYVKFKFE